MNPLYFNRRSFREALIDTIEDCAVFAVIMAISLVWAVM